MAEQGLNPDTRDRITKLTRIADRTFDELEERFWEVYNSEFLAESALPETIRQSMAINVLVNENVSSVPAESATFVPVGFSGSKFKTPTRDVFILEKGGSALKRLVFRGEKIADKAYQLECGHLYTDVKVGKYSTGEDYFFINTTRIPPATGKNVLEAILAKLNVPVVTSRNITRNPSHKRSDGYTDETDWRMIQGMVQSQYVGNRKTDNTPFGVLNIMDEFAADNLVIKDDGTVDIPTITGWTDPRLIKFPNNSICKFYGPVSVDEDQKPTMNIYQIVVLHMAPAQNVNTPSDELEIEDEE